MNMTNQIDEIKWTKFTLPNRTNAIDAGNDPPTLIGDTDFKLLLTEFIV